MGINLILVLLVAWITTKLLDECETIRPVWLSWFMGFFYLAVSFTVMISIMLKGCT